VDAHLAGARLGHVCLHHLQDLGTAVLLELDRAHGTLLSECSTESEHSGVYGFRRTLGKRSTRRRRRGRRPCRHAPFIRSRRTPPARTPSPSSPLPRTSPIPSPSRSSGIWRPPPTGPAPAAASTYQSARRPSAITSRSCVRRVWSSSATRGRGGST